MRWYTVSDPPGTEPIRLPSVTTILDVTMPQARRDTLVRAEMASPVSYTLRREQALARGNAVDGWLKGTLKAGHPLPRPFVVDRQCQRLLPLVRGILQNRSPIWTDEQVHSVTLGYAGTLDLVATLPRGLRAVIEIKSAAYTIWPEAIAEAQLQAIAYFLAWARMYPDRPLDAIATYHVTPYTIHAQITHKPEILTRLTSSWLLRLKHFASRFNQMEL